MMTLRQLAGDRRALPTRTTWYLADLGEARGKQELFTGQSPQKLKVLRDRALIQSAVSSHRVQGVEVERSRVAVLKRLQTETAAGLDALLNHACKGEWQPMFSVRVSSIRTAS
jgi:hypothetical protein